MENVSDHGTIGPRKFWGSQKIFQANLYKIFQVKQILIKNRFVHGHGFPDNILHFTAPVCASIDVCGDEMCMMKT